jgi:hypothetical protein
MALDTVIMKGRYFFDKLVIQVCLNDEQLMQFRMLQETTQKIPSAIMTNTSYCFSQTRIILLMIAFDIYVYMRVLHA